jgi:UDP-N-acetylmuramate: L-alanyl-gamma-D-glutamyl-meso-diaminopimelate ligase
LIYLLAEGFSAEQLKLAAKDIGMVKRRQEVRGKYRDMIVVDDFAHHPRAISVTLEAIRDRYKNKKIITVFEPISATARSSIFQGEFRDSLLGSDSVIIAKASIPTTAIGGKDLDCDQLSLEISQQGKKAVTVSSLNELREKIDTFASKDSLLLVLSNRTCLGLWESDFVEQLKP